ncbi:hypothetical protein J0910_02360 [Nocardiopsis sp. CNT-189]|uniref:hypothetical protein n=1 Tax=Nocardiopsis oceanisediminis TaxID=2816862 RepID=UPI003B30D208
MTRQIPFAALLPLYTLDLARRYWAPLLCVWLLGDFAHRMAMRGMAQLVAIEPYFGYAALGIVLVLQLAAYIIMFHMLRPGLPAVDAEYRRARGTGERRGLAEAERNLVDAVAVAILPFLIFYSAWDLIAEEYRRFLIATVNQEGMEFLLDIGAMNATGPLIAMALLAFGLRAFFEYVYDQTGSKTTGVLTALFEATWTFLALFSVVDLLGRFWAWVDTRAATVAVHDTLNAGLAWANGLVTPFPLQELVLGAIGAVTALWAMLKGGFIEPLLWLTITAVVFGAQMDRYTGLFRKDTRAGRVERAIIAGRRGPLRTAAGWVRRDMGDKYVPFLNAFRFILGTSPVFYLSFSLYYVLLELGFDRLERGVFVAVGPAEWLGWWWPWMGPVEVVLDAAKYMLRICLLAAAFELILRKVGGRSTGRRARARTGAA